MGFLERKLFDDYPHVIGVSLAGILSVFSLGPTPGMIPIIFTLSILLIYSRKIFPTQAPHKSRHTIVLWVALTIGSSIPRITPSIHALSQPVLSVLFLFILSGITSALSIGALFIETRVSSRYSSGHDTIRLLLFPTWWTTIWTAIAYLSPLGMLSTWSPVEGISAYDWMLPIFGLQSLNWVVAAWAVVMSETLMSLYMGSESQDKEDSNLFIPTETRGNHRDMAVIPTGDHNTVHNTLSKRDKTAVLAALLVLLIVPSYSIDSLPVPLGDVSIATPLSVGCALPTVDEYKVPKFDFGHYLTETKRLDSTANFILWPESAVHFDSEADRNQHLDEIRKQIHHAFVGVSFDETLVDTENSKNRYGIKRNGIAIVSNRSDTPHLVYYKRHLVPIAESFSLTHSLTPPTTFKAEIHYKNYPIKGHERDVIVTTSICLDFSDPSLFKSLEVRPGLILAPGRTWDVTVGYTMWKQASQRAHEIESSLLWCDGGEGGVSGVVGRGTSEVFQVGAGSWVRTIGVQHPFNEQRRTFYAQHGNSALLLFWVLLGMAPIGRAFQSFFEKVKRRRRATSGTSDVPEVPVCNLIDSGE